MLTNAAYNPHLVMSPSTFNKQLNSSLMMSLGAGALKVSRGAKCNKQRGGIHGNPGSGKHPKSSH